MPSRPLVFIAAVARNRVIGAAGHMPWRISGDLAHFRARTMGKPMLMGQKTFAAIGRALPGRSSVVVTRDPGFHPPGVTVAHHLDDAVAEAQALAEAAGVDEIMVVGGAEIYRALLAEAHELDITEVDLQPAGDAWFPPIDPAVWTAEDRRPGTPLPGEPAYRYVRYIRRDTKQGLISTPTP